MYNRRNFLIALSAGALAVPLGSLAQQQATKIARIGVLHPRPTSSALRQVEFLRAGLRDLGYAEGRNISIVFRSAEGIYDRLPDLAAELVRLEVDVLVTGGTPGTRALKHATSAIPIVMQVAGDAVGSGLIASLARPGGNITGSTYFDPELTAKRLELLKEVMPRSTRVAVLLNPSNSQVMGTTLQALQDAAKLMKVDLQQFEAQATNEIDAAFSAMAKRRVHAVEVIDDAMFLANLRAIADLAVIKHLPSIGAKEFAEAGGLIGYGVNFDEMWRHAAYFVDKILKGAKPADVPVERATKFELVVNMKTAKALGIKIPNSILVRADKLIE